MDVNAAVAAAAAIAGVLTGVIAMLAFRWSERDQKRPTRTSLHTDPVLPPGVDTVLSVLRSSAVVLDEADAVVKASSAAYALGLVRGGKLSIEPMLQMARDTRRDGEIRQVELDLPRRGTGRGEALAVSARVAPLGSRLVLLLVEDLTEARRIEAVRRDFVANVSHELKTPVGALSLLSEAVMDASEDPEAVERFAGRMQIEATRLTNLVQELIDLSRVQNDDPLGTPSPSGWTNSSPRRSTGAVTRPAQSRSLWPPAAPPTCMSGATAASWPPPSATWWRTPSTTPRPAPGSG
jgi:two-component system, OmpR family, sensor histidine kinase SenX3